MCQITILNLGWKVEDSDLAHLFEDADKVKIHFEIKPPLKRSIILYLKSLLMASSLLLKGSLYFGFTASCWSFRIWFSIQATFLCLLLGGAAAPTAPGVRVGVEIPPLGLGAVCNIFGVLLSLSFGCRIVPAPIGRGRLCWAWKKKNMKNKLKFSQY